MIEEDKLASEKQKNIQTAAEFWADMRKTHGFQNQSASLKFQAVAVTEVARAREPGSSPKQQVEAHLESQENPERRRRSDDEYKNPTNHSLSQERRTIQSIFQIVMCKRRLGSTSSSTKRYQKRQMGWDTFE